MTFSEALETIKSNKMAQRVHSRRSFQVIWLESGFIVGAFKNPPKFGQSFAYEDYCDNEDLLAEDWEVVE